MLAPPPPASAAGLLTSAFATSTSIRLFGVQAVSRRRCCRSGRCAGRGGQRRRRRADRRSRWGRRSRRRRGAVGVRAGVDAQDLCVGEVAEAQQTEGTVRCHRVPSISPRSSGTTGEPWFVPGTRGYEPAGVGELASRRPAGSHGDAGAGFRPQVPPTMRRVAPRGRIRRWRWESWVAQARTLALAARREQGWDGSVADSAANARKAALATRRWKSSPGCTDRVRRL